MILTIFFTLIVLLSIWFIKTAYSTAQIKHLLKKQYKRQKLKKSLLERVKILQSLRTEEFDVFIIGGGCIGTGCAMDATTRGLKTGLIEALDFGSETSSKSTKLLHGGIRYLEKALFRMGLGHLKLLIEALGERRAIMRMAPYLTKTVKILVPIYSTIKLPGNYLLAKLYDWLSWENSLGRSYLISDKMTRMYFSNLKREGPICSIVYHDGMMRDHRINTMLAKTAIFYGATVANHVRFLDFIKNENNKILGARVRNELTKEIFEVHSKVFIAAVGPFTDKVFTSTIQSGNEKDYQPLLAPSIGTHIAIKPGFGTEGMGILNTNTFDNRMVFILPWNNHTIIGSTEVSGEPEEQKKPTEKEVDFLLDELNKYTEIKLLRRDVTSAWTGIRPLIKDGTNKLTECLVRKSLVRDDGNGVIIVTGGKWTTFRSMAERAVNAAVTNYQLEITNGCLTTQIEVIGSKKYSRDLFHEIARVLEVDIEYAKHLLGMYGHRAFKLNKYIKRYPEKLSDVYPFTEGEAIYCLEKELATNATDIVNIRFGVGYYDVLAAANMIKRVDLLLIAYFEKRGQKYQPDPEYTRRTLDSLGHSLVKKFQGQK